MKKQKKNKLIEAGNRLVVSREEQGGGESKTSKGSQLMVMNGNWTYDGEHNETDIML